MTEHINHPNHYNAGGPKESDGTAKYEVIKIIENLGLGFKLGNALKYVIRAPYKVAEIQDLEKARWYLQRAITNPEDVHPSSDEPMLPVDVCSAWGLSGDIAECVERIMFGEPKRALRCLDDHLATTKAAESLCAAEDRRILDEMTKATKTK